MRELSAFAPRWFGAWIDLLSMPSQRDRRAF